jgi:hypothetical protein
VPFVFCFALLYLPATDERKKMRREGFEKEKRRPKRGDEGEERKTRLTCTRQPTTHISLISTEREHDEKKNLRHREKSSKVACMH